MLLTLKLTAPFKQIADKSETASIASGCVTETVTGVLKLSQVPGPLSSDT